VVPPIPEWLLYEGVFVYSCPKLDRKLEQSAVPDTEGATLWECFKTSTGLALRRCLFGSSHVVADELCGTLCRSLQGSSDGLQAGVKE